jgi:hypothetical protein
MKLAAHSTMSPTLTAMRQSFIITLYVGIIQQKTLTSVANEYPKKNIKEQGEILRIFRTEYKSKKKKLKRKKQRPQEV